jgi:hypothetical protein
MANQDLWQMPADQVAVRKHLAPAMAGADFEQC